ncbi:MAG: hypothetical protein FJ102_19520 [Deltaproteobacteria bacterium]|nr:hypothetical protein [Deltaproteobacteria bacterium]
MTLTQCKAVVLHGRDETGNRAGLIPPRRCNRPATAGDYCVVHVRQAEMQDLLKECLHPSWEARVQLWEDRKRRDAEKEGQRISRGLATFTRRARMPDLSVFFATHASEIAQRWAAG